uniref:Uncharacterized protein n=1 Tax=Arundo donax TaxID=35708 RepID=A0A0A9QSH9_ARUDO
MHHRFNLTRCLVMLLCVPCPSPRRDGGRVQCHMEPKRGANFLQLPIV